MCAPILLRCLTTSDACFNGTCPPSGVLIGMLAIALTSSLYCGKKRTTTSKRRSRSSTCVMACPPTAAWSVPRGKPCG